MTNALSGYHYQVIAPERTRTDLWGVNSCFRGCVLVLPVLLLGDAVFAQRARLDSLLHILEKRPDADADRMNTLIKLADTYATIDYPKSLEAAREAWRIADALDDDKGRAEAWVSECLSHYTVGEYTASDSLDRLARTVADPVKSPRAYAYALQWGHCHINAMDTSGLARAREEMTRAIHLFYALGDSADLARALCGWGGGPLLNENADSLEKGLALAERIGDQQTLISYQAYLCNYEPYASDQELQVRNFHEVLRLADSTGHMDGAVSARLNLNYILSSRSDVVGALTSLVEALPLAEAYGVPFYVAGLECNYGYLLLDLGQYDEARTHFRTGFAASDFLDYRLNNLTGLADAFLRQRLPDSAMVYLRMAAALNAGDKATGHDGEIQGLEAEAHSLKGEYLTAFRAWEKAIAVHDTMRNAFGNIEARETARFGRALLAAPEDALHAYGLDREAAWARAAGMLELSVDLGRERALMKERSEALLGLSELAALRDDAASALRYHQQHTALKDSILNENKTKAFALMQVRFQSERKEQRIALLAKEKELQAREMDEQKLIRNGIIGGLALMALFIWSRLRLTRRKNAEILRAQRCLLESERQREAEQVRTRIARDVHDDISSDITKIGMLGADVKVEMASDAAAARLKLDRIKELSRDVGRSLQDIVWAVDPTQDSARELVDRARVYAERMLSDGHLRFSLRFGHTGPDVVLDAATRRDILLLLKEALNNALKYADARHVEVSLLTEPRGFELRVQDDGKGFDIATSRDRGNGLGNMEARAKRLGATWSIRSSPGHGTEVTTKGAWVGAHIGIGV